MKGYLADTLEALRLTANGRNPRATNRGADDGSMEIANFPVGLLKTSISLSFLEMW